VTHFFLPKDGWTSDQWSFGKNRTPDLSLAENNVVGQYKIKVFLWNYLLILKILSATLFSDPTTFILTLLLQTGSRLWSSKIIPKAAQDNYIFAHFRCSQWGVDAGEYWPIPTKELLYTSIHFYLEGFP
jgi:hypothetical protein